VPGTGPDPHVRGCGRGRCHAAPYPIVADSRGYRALWFCQFAENVGVVASSRMVSLPPWVP